MLWKTFIAITVIVADVYGRDEDMAMPTLIAEICNATDRISQVKTSYSTFLSCVGGEFLLDNNGMEMCSNTKNYSTCINKLYKSISPCPVFNDIFHNDQLGGLMVEFMCEDRNKNFPALADYWDCFYNKPTRPNLSLVDSEYARCTSPIKRKTKVCTAVEQRRKCLMKVLKMCNIPSSAIVVEKLFKKIPCNGHPIICSKIFARQSMKDTEVRYLLIAKTNKLRQELGFSQNACIRNDTATQVHYKCTRTLRNRTQLPSVCRSESQSAQLCFTMIWILSLLVALIPVLTVEAWGKYNTLEQKQITEYITKLCTKSGAEDKVPQVLDAIENFEKCSVSLFKDEVLLEEVATAIRNNDLNGVFKKYCARTGRLAACTYSLIDSVGLCVGGADLPAAHNFVDQLLGFVCHNDGERIGLFIQEGGPQCFQQNVGALNGCAAKVLSEIDGVQPIKERCTKFDELSKCLVETVSTCSPAAPGDMMRALLAHVRQATPCAGDDDTFRTYMRWLQDRKDNPDQHSEEVTMTGVIACMPIEYHKLISAVTDVMDDLIDFVCYKDGERIAFLKSVASFEIAMTFSSQDKCNKFDELSTCVITEIQGCKNQAATNMTESLFRFAKDELACEN
ncbi:uncharacterized protein LOC133519487 [Cydia pomonella]|uniref:uncharacterized protein LOC133519487 n=1 Tax=Cydia pomonella TaxID=82600 RepID=UPI002ADE5330|nr:uncharacterized protein LOC133519487 [Cydia pomonella]